MVKRNRLNRESKKRNSRLKRPFEYGVDVRGDRALFVPEDVRLDDSKLVQQVRQIGGGEAVFFRIINKAGIQRHAHGWMEARNGSVEIVQWG